MKRVLAGIGLFFAVSVSVFGLAGSSGYMLDRLATWGCAFGSAVYAAATLIERRPPSWLHSYSSAVAAGTLMPLIVMLALHRFQVSWTYATQAFAFSLPVGLSFGSVLPLIWITFGLNNGVVEASPESGEDGA